VSLDGNPARGDDVHSDVKWPQLARPSPGETELRTFGGDVGRAAGQRIRSCRVSSSFTTTIRTLAPTAGTPMHRAPT
jgi:hypothetical protein